LVLFCFILFSLVSKQKVTKERKKNKQRQQIERGTNEKNFLFRI